MISKLKIDSTFLKNNEFIKECNNEIKSIYNALEDGEIVPFNMIFKLIIFLYYHSKTDDERKNILTNFIIDEQISTDYLDKLKNKEIKDDKNFNKFYSLLKFSLPKNKKVKYIQYTSESIKNDENQIWFANCDIINEFNNIILFIEKKINNKENPKKKEILNEIDNKINNLLNIFSIDFTKYKFPPINGNINYIYNYYFREFIYFISLFQKKRVNESLFSSVKNNKIIKKEEKYENYTSIDDKYNFYIKLFNFLDIFKKMNFDDNNIKNCTKLKIMLFFLILFEEKRTFASINLSLLQKVIIAINSKPISKEILKKYIITDINENKIIKEKDWDSLNINDFIKINLNYSNINIKIKSYNSNLINLNEKELFISLQSKEIDYLNYEGLLNNNYIKTNIDIENEIKNLLFSILQSVKSEENFKEDEKFKNYKYIFKSRYAREIFEEIWENLLIIPIPFKAYNGYNIRYHYSIFINSSIKYEEEYSLNILPIIHALINDIYHEIFHSISLLYCVTFDINSMNTPEKKNNDLILKQKGIIKKYNLRNEKIIEEFKDLGEYMEILYYNIRPKCFATYSSLYFFSNKGLSTNGTLDKYYELFNSNEQLKKNDIFKEDFESLESKNKIINLNESDDEKALKLEHEQIIKDEIKILFNIKIMKILMQIYPITNEELITNSHYIHINPGRNDNDSIITNMTFIRGGECFVDRREIKKNLLEDFGNNSN